MTPTSARYLKPAVALKTFEAGKTDQEQISEDHADYQFAQHGGHAQSFKGLTTQLGGEQDDHNPQQIGRQRTAAVAAFRIVGLLAGPGRHG